MAHVVLRRHRLGVVLQRIAEHLVEGGDTGRRLDGHRRIDAQRPVGRVVHRLAQSDFGQREVVLLLRQEVVVRGLLRLDLRHVGGALQPQLEELAALLELGRAGLELLAGQPHALGVVDHVEVGLHGLQRNLVAGQLQLLDPLQAHDAGGTHGVDAGKSGKEGQLPREGVGVVEVRDVGIGIGLGVYRTAEAGRGADRAAHRGDQRGDGFDIILAVVAVGVGLAPHGGAVLDGVAHALLERHRRRLPFGRGDRVIGSGSGRSNRDALYRVGSARSSLRGCRTLHVRRHGCRRKQGHQTECPENRQQRD